MLAVSISIMYININQPIRLDSLEQMLVVLTGPRSLNVFSVCLCVFPFLLEAWFVVMDHMHAVYLSVIIVTAAMTLTLILF